MASHIRVNEMCVLCSKTVTASPRHMSCDLCRKLTNLQCISSTMSHYLVLISSVYYCCNCVASISPCNHMTNNEESINAISYLSADYPLLLNMLITCSGGSREQCCKAHNGICLKIHYSGSCHADTG